MGMVATPGASIQAFKSLQNVISAPAQVSAP